MTLPVTVIVPVRGTVATVAPLLHGLSAQAGPDGPVPVIVSDDASATPLAPAFGGLDLPGLDVTVVRGERNAGPGAARNRALAAAATPWVAFVDADELPGPGYVERLAAAAQDPETPDLVSGRVVMRAAPGAFEHATAISVGDGQYGAGNLLIRTAVLRELGGFDERFYDPAKRLHFREDAELHFRFSAAGREAADDPELVVEHPPLAATLWGPVRLARRYYFDPLLAREHPERFRALSRARRVRGLSLRRARHHAAFLHVTAAAALLAGLAARRLRVPAGLTLLAAWGANAAALVFGRRLRVRDVPAVALVAAVMPLSYVWHFLRGVVAFRHWPRF